MTDDRKLRDDVVAGLEARGVEGVRLAIITSRAGPRDQRSGHWPDGSQQPGIHCSGDAELWLRRKDAEREAILAERSEGCRTFCKRVPNLHAPHAGHDLTRRPVHGRDFLGGTLRFARN